MSNTPPRRRRLRSMRAVALSLLVLIAGSLLTPVSPAAAEDYVPINGAGSSWSSNAVDQWRRNVQQYGMTVNYSPNGSSDGRNQFKAGTVDFAVSEIPYGLTDGGVVDTPPSRGYAYMPIVAGGTAFMYNLSVGGKRITNLRLSGEVITKIFTGVITQWNDKEIAADNPGLNLPKAKIVPVVRSDGSGSTAQFATWMAAEHQGLWDQYCAAAGRSTPCGVTSNYPIVAGKGFVAQPQSQGVSGYVAQTANVGTITYVEYSYALKTGYPVAKVLNAADYYVEPTASNVAVGLLGAKINEEQGPNYLTQILDGVYNNKDARTYPLSSYSYMIVPTSTQNGFDTKKGKTLSEFANYFLCEGQQQAEVLGYSPLPQNLVQAGLAQVKGIPGANTKNIDIAKCNNPTFSSDGTNTLANNAPQPDPCDKKGSTQCTEGTGGAQEETPGGGGGSGDGKGGSGDGTADPTQSATGDGTGTGTGTGGSSGSGSSGSGSSGSGTTGTTGGVAGAAAAGVDCQRQADTGLCEQVFAEPVDAAAKSGWTMQTTLMVGAVLLILALIFVPPLVARATRKGRR